MQIVKSLLLLGTVVVPATRVVAQEMKHEMQMMMQPGADRMKIALLSPSAGTRITGNTLRLKVTTSGFHDSCTLAGKPNRGGEGHYHVLLDKSLVNMFCANTATVSLQGVKPGIHTLTVVPAQNDHTEIEKNARSIGIIYQPSSSQPAPPKTSFAGPPSIRIVSPAPGTALSGSFDVVVEVRNFELTCDEMGKPDVAGHGHWHLNLDSMTGPMMGMMTMVAMSCERVLHASTAGLKPGSTHTLIALLADNVHAPVMPTVAARVTIKVK